MLRILRRFLSTYVYYIIHASSNREYLGRVDTVVTAVTESAPSHIASLHQPILSFYSFGDSFVKYVLGSIVLGGPSALRSPEAI